MNCMELMLNGVENCVFFMWNNNEKMITILNATKNNMQLKWSEQKMNKKKIGCLLMASIMVSTFSTQKVFANSINELEGLSEATSSTLNTSDLEVNISEFDVNFDGDGRVLVTFNIDKEVSLKLTSKDDIVIKATNMSNGFSKTKAKHYSGYLNDEAGKKYGMGSILSPGTYTTVFAFDEFKGANLDQIKVELTVKNDGMQSMAIFDRTPAVDGGELPSIGVESKFPVTKIGCVGDVKTFTNNSGQTFINFEITETIDKLGTKDKIEIRWFDIDGKVIKQTLSHYTNFLTPVAADDITGSNPLGEKLGFLEVIPAGYYAISLNNSAAVSAEIKVLNFTDSVDGSEDDDMQVNTSVSIEANKGTVNEGEEIKISLKLPISIENIEDVTVYYKAVNKDNVERIVPLKGFTYNAETETHELEITNTADFAGEIFSVEKIEVITTGEGVIEINSEEVDLDGGNFEVIEKEVDKPSEGEGEESGPSEGDGEQNPSEEEEDGDIETPSEEESEDSKEESDKIEEDKPQEEGDKEQLPQTGGVVGTEMLLGFGTAITAIGTVLFKKKR